MIFRSNDGYANAPQYFVTRRLKAPIAYLVFSRYTASMGGMFGERRTRRDLEGNGRDLIEVTYQNKPGENDENHEKPQEARCSGRNLKWAQPQIHTRKAHYTCTNLLGFIEFANCTYIYTIISTYRTITGLDVRAVCIKQHNRGLRQSYK